MLGKESTFEKWRKIAESAKLIARVPLMVLAIGVSAIAAWLLLVFAWRLGTALYERFLSQPWNW